VQPYLLPDLVKVCYKFYLKIGGYMGKKSKKNEHSEEDVVIEHDHCDCDEGHECECSCCEDEYERPHIERQFYTKAEKIAMLEEYLEELKAEAAGVEEELAELRK
jgi:hypothetical protein